MFLTLYSTQTYNTTQIVYLNKYHIFLMQKIWLYRWISLSSTPITPTIMPTTTTTSGQAVPIGVLRILG